AGCSAGAGNPDGGDAPDSGSATTDDAGDAGAADTDAGSPGEDAGVAGGDAGHGDAGFDGGPANRSPVVVGTPPASTSEDTALAFSFVVSDPDGDTVTCTMLGLPAWLAFDPQAHTL